MHELLSEIVDDLNLIHDKTLMMGIFDELAEEVPQFINYRVLTFETQ